MKFDFTTIYYFTCNTSSKSQPADELIDRINSSKMSSETKEIFKLFLTMFSILQLDLENKVPELTKQIRVNDNNNN